MTALHVTALSSILDSRAIIIIYFRLLNATCKERNRLYKIYGPKKVRKAARYANVTEEQIFKEMRTFNCQIEQLTQFIDISKLL